MKVAFRLIAFSAITVAICWVAGIVSFTRVTIMANESLRHPCRVKEVDGTNLLLESGQIIGLDARRSLYNISNLIFRSDFQVDVEQGGTNVFAIADNEQGNTNRLDVFVRRRPKSGDFIRPLAFTIPLIQKTEKRNGRVWIASGRYLVTNSQPKD